MASWHAVSSRKFVSRQAQGIVSRRMFEHIIYGSGEAFDDCAKAHNHQRLLHSHIWNTI